MEQLWKIAFKAERLHVANEAMKILTHLYLAGRWNEQAKNMDLFGSFASSLTWTSHAKFTYLGYPSGLNPKAVVLLRLEFDKLALPIFFPKFSPFYHKLTPLRIKTLDVRCGLHAINFLRKWNLFNTFAKLENSLNSKIIKNGFYVYFFLYLTSVYNLLTRYLVDGHTKICLHANWTGICCCEVFKNNSTISSVSHSCIMFPHRKFFFDNSNPLIVFLIVSCMSKLFYYPEVNIGLGQLLRN